MPSFVENKCQQMSSFIPMIVNHSGVHSEKRSLHHLQLDVVMLERFVGEITILNKRNRNATN